MKSWKLHSLSDILTKSGIASKSPNVIVFFGGIFSHLLEYRIGGRFVMMDFFLPNSRALLPTFRTNCPDEVSFCPDVVSFCPDFNFQLPTPVLYSAVTHPFRGYVRT